MDQNFNSIYSISFQPVSFVGRLGTTDNWYYISPLWRKAPRAG